MLMAHRQAAKPATGPTAPGGRPRCTVRATAQHGNGAGSSSSSSRSRGGVEAVIVGGGIGGLACAAALLEAGVSVKVFEARSREAALTGPGGIQLQASGEWGFGCLYVFVVGGGRGA